MQIFSHKADNLQYILVIISNNKNTTGRKFAKIKMGIFIIFSTKAMQIFWDYTSVFANVSTAKFVVFNFVKKLDTDFRKTKTQGMSLNNWITRMSSEQLLVGMSKESSCLNSNSGICIITIYSRGTKRVRFPCMCLSPLSKHSEIRLK